MLWSEEKSVEILLRVEIFHILTKLKVAASMATHILGGMRG